MCIRDSLWGPLAINETLAPALLKQHPIYPPIAPAPNTQIFISTFLYSKPSFSASPILCNLPVAPFGISSKKRIYFGILKSARCFRA